MNFVQENLQILATLGSALAVYIFIRLAASKDVKALGKDIRSLESRFEKRFDSIDHRMDKMESSILDVRKDIQSLDSRISRIEGQLISYFRYEPFIREVKEE